MPPTCGQAETCSTWAAAAAAPRSRPGRSWRRARSGPMLARARVDAGAAGLGNAVFLQGDAQVHPLEPARFGTVLSRFGVMFFADSDGVHLGAAVWLVQAVAPRTTARSEG